MFHMFQSVGTQANNGTNWHQSSVTTDVAPNNLIYRMTKNNPIKHGSVVHVKNGRWAKLFCPNVKTQNSSKNPHSKNILSFTSGFRTRRRSMGCSTGKKNNLIRCNHITPRQSLETDSLGQNTTPFVQYSCGHRCFSFDD